MGAEPRFRGDIQGLRAVAVLVVVAAHAGVPFLPGGFVGVDVFFVVSGYLIAGLLYREISARSTFSLTTFWSRRARRILPAATVVTLVTLLYSLLWMSVIDARQVVTDGLWSTLFAANVHFAQQDISYFAQDSGTSPLQHYWSLAVEEQFYVVWPLLLLACLALTGLATRGRTARARHPQHRLPRRAIALMLVVLTGASFAWSVVQTADNPGVAYFSTFTRAWEIGLGALCALLSVRLTRRIGRRSATAMALVGLGAIALACLTFTPEVAFPGYAAALPVLGAALLLVAGSGPEAPLTARALDNRPMRVLGDWSYSLYLWHWPALVLPPRLLLRELTPAEVVAALAVTVALAALTFHYVETPFRTGRLARRLRGPRTLLLYPVCLALVASSCLGAWRWTDSQLGENGDNPPIVAAGADPDDTVALVRASVDAAHADRAIPSDLSPDLVRLRESIASVAPCDYAEEQEGVDVLCPRGDQDGERTMVLIGDSHARAWIPAFDRIGAEAGWKNYYLVKSQCTAAHVTVAPVDEERPFTECSDFQDWVVEQVDELQPDLVVIASSPPVNGVYEGEDRWVRIPKVAPLLTAGYDDLFTDLMADSQRVVLLRDVPKSPGDPGTCLTQGDPSLGSCMFTPEARALTLGDLGVASALDNGAEVVDPTRWLCYRGDCPVVIGGTLSYRDSNHITTEYAESLATPLGDALQMLDR